MISLLMIESKILKSTWSWDLSTTSDRGTLKNFFYHLGLLMLKKVVTAETLLETADRIHRFERRGSMKFRLQWEHFVSR